MFPHTPKQNQQVEIIGLRGFSGGRALSCRTDNSKLYLKTKELRQRSRVANLKFHLGGGGNLNKDSHSDSSIVGNNRAGMRNRVANSGESSLERIHTFNLKITPSAEISNKSSVLSSSQHERQRVRDLSSPNSDEDVSEAPQRKKFSNLRNLLSMKTAAAE